MFLSAGGPSALVGALAAGAALPFAAPPAGALAAGAAFLPDCWVGEGKGGGERGRGGGGEKTWRDGGGPKVEKWGHARESPKGRGRQASYYAPWFTSLVGVGGGWAAG